MRAEQCTDPVAFHAEGPVWWPDDGSDSANRLRWVDMMNGRVLTQMADGIRADSVNDPVAAFIRPRRGGGAVVGTSRGVSLSGDAALGSLAPLASLVEGPQARLNECGCSPAGTLLAGAMRYDQAAGGASLWDISPDGSIATVRDDVTVSNGIDWSPDGALAYYNDTPTRGTTVYSWDPERGLHDPRNLFTLDDEDPAGGPDGLCVDSEGNIWTAIYGGSRVECRDPAGRLIERVELPVTQVTACTFGGPELDQLYITTSRENLEAGAQSQAGAIFAVAAGVRGQPVRTFAG